VVREVFGRGTIESRREAQLGFDLAGRISDVLVDEGDHVKLGQVLAHLEPQQYQADMRTAASGASVAQAATIRLEAEQRRADVSLAYAEHEEQRSRKLASAGAISARDLDLAVQQLALARAEEARVQAAQGEGRRNVEVAKGGLAFRKAVATRTSLVSPFEGRMFAVILVLTSSVVFAVILYNMTLDKTHAIAMLRLIGSPARRIVGMVVQQAWMLGILAYALAVGIGMFPFPHFPRRVVMTDGILWAGLALVVLVSTLSSALGIRYAMNVDAGKVLEG